MWLIPSSIQSRFAQASECSTLDLTADLNTSASEFARLCTVSGKHTQPASYLRSWKRDAWTQRLFGRTLQPSMQGRFVAWWTSSLEDSHASPTASPASSKDSATDAATARATGQSLTPCESFKSVSPPWSGLKTYLPGFAEDSSSQSQKDYASWVTQSLDHSLSLRRTLAHRTNGNVSLLWPSCRAEDSESCGNHPGATDSLDRPTIALAAKVWQTPATDSVRSRGGDRKAEMGIDQQARMWTTPTATEEQKDRMTDAAMRREMNRENAGNALAKDVRFWTTPDVSSGARDMSKIDPEAQKRADTKRTTGLPTEVKQWATPKTITGGANSQRDARGAGGADLQEQILNWPTPAARDEKGANSQEHATVTGGGQETHGSVSQLCGPFAPGPSDPRWTDILDRFPGLSPALIPGVRMLADGTPLVLDESRRHQLRAVGNGAVPLAFATAIVHFVRGLA